MLVRKPPSKKKSTTHTTTGISLDSSLTSIEWLPKMQIGENPLPSSSASSISSSTTITVPHQQSLPTSSLPITLSRETNITPKIEANEIDTSTTTVHMKPPYSYVTLIRQAILSTTMQKMTLNEIYQWIVESYPYFRTAPPKWKNSIRHNLSLNKCFKRLQRSTNDPGKGSYWAVDESNENNHQSNSRKRRFGDIPPSLHILPSSPTGLHQQSTAFYTNNNPMICGDVSSIGGQSSSADESDSTMSLVANNNLIEWDDLNVDLSASFRRFREQILEGQSASWITTTDAPSTNAIMANSWNHEQIFPHSEPNNFFESFKLGTNGEMNWNDIDVKPYPEVADSFRTNPTLQQQDREKLINLASSLSSFFDYSAFTSFAHNRNPNESMTANRFPALSNRSISEPIRNHTPLPVVIEDDGFDWDSIT